MLRALVRLTASIVLIIAVRPTSIVADSAIAQIVPGTQASTDSFGAEIERILSIKASKADLMPAIREAVKSQNDPAKKADSLAKLVNTILDGPDPASLVKKISSALDVDSKAFPPPDVKDWGVGGPADWMALSNELWKMAAAVKDKDAKRASDLAKASLMISVQGDFFTSWRGLSAHIMDPEAEKILGLTQPQFSELKKALQERVDQDSLWLEEMVESYKLIDAISEGGNDVDVEKAKTIMEHFDKSFRKGPPQIGYRWVILRQSWQFLNLAKKRQANAAQAVIKAQLEKWKHDFSDQDIQRWVAQSLTRDGPPPGKLHVEIKK
jgi:hypothetical protein